MLEKYADNLEELVDHRTAELQDEKRKTDMLLYRLMPRYLNDMCTSVHVFDLGVQRPVPTYKFVNLNLRVPVASIA